MADPTQSYLAWFFQTYFPPDVDLMSPQFNEVLKRYVFGGDNQYRQYWEQYIKSPELTPEMERVREREILESILSNASSEEQLDDLLYDYQQAGIITQEEGDDFYSQYSDRAFLMETVGQEGLDYLSQYTSSSDLADRLNRLKVDESIKPQLYEATRSITPSSQVAMSAAGAREAKAQADILEAEQKETLKQQKEALKQQKEALKQQTQRAGELEKAVNQTLQNPWVTAAQKQDLRQRIMGAQGQDYVTGRTDDIVKWINLVNQTAQSRSVSVSARQAGEGQTADALMRGAFLEERKPVTAGIPTIPSERGVAESFIRGTGLGEGTSLRDFLERSFLPEIAEETRGKRMAWWQRINEPPRELPVFEEEQAKLREEAARWQRVAATAPTSEVAGNVQYGPGGLKAIAERAFQTAQEQLAALRPEDFPGFGLGIPDPRMKREPVRQEEDPFRKALRERKFRAEHFRRPGTGIVSRLQPAARF